jgi:hypothetical protein
VFPHDGSGDESLIADADRRMYRDKAIRRGGLLFDGAAPTHTAPSRAERFLNTEA